MEDTNSFGEKADILNQRFYLLLENFKNSYILHKENVNYSVNKTRFEEEKDKLQNYSKTILLVDNKIDVKTNELNFFIKNNNKIAITESNEKGNMRWGCQSAAYGLFHCSLPCPPLRSTSGVRTKAEPTHMPTQMWKLKENKKNK